MKAKETQEELIKRISSCHVMVYAGDGNSRPAELLFSTGNAAESRAICELLLQLLEKKHGAATCGRP